MTGSRTRSFDPRAVGRWECRAWETYYRRQWGAFLVASVALVRAAFRMSWWDTLLGAWLVLRANQKWAPFPDNYPDAARSLMTRFYELLRESERAAFHPARAAELEVEWWRAHRDAQHPERGGSQEQLVTALANLYAYTYSQDPADVRLARSFVPTRWRSRVAGCRMAATPRTRGSPRSTHSSSALMRRCSPPCTAD